MVREGCSSSTEGLGCEGWLPDGVLYRLCTACVAVQVRYISCCSWYLRGRPGEGG
jgi:hypothetical protein